MPEDVEKHARKELKRLEQMSEQSAEYSMLLTYMNWLVELPWAVPTPRTRSRSPRRARILDADHFGLDKVKRRILEYLAVRKLNPQGKSPILCFVGPPGVGKTSLGQSIARAMGRKFVRLSLGGVHDEAEIRGHRRTYVGAMPGNIIQAIRKAGTRNCVMMLDEMDKLGAGIHGDPSSALLEVLDPEQNSTFRDNYLGVPFDLSRVMFIGTANVLDRIPGPLRDRMEVIELPGLHGGREVADRAALPGAAPARGDRAHGRAGGDHRRGASRGDRRLHARGGRAQPRARDRQPVPPRGDADRRGRGRRRCASTRRDVATILGAAPLRERAGDAHQRSGRCDRARVDARRRRHPVHRGDAHAWDRQADPHRPARRRDEGERAGGADARQGRAASACGAIPAMFEKSDVHLHIPAGAIPKDGPSAGVAMFVALASLLLDQPVRHDVAMTGEISLRGLVLPIGGIKEKVLAALRAGIETVMLPARNRKDLDDVPEDARKRLEFVCLETVDDALRDGDRIRSRRITALPGVSFGRPVAAAPRERGRYTRPA